MDARSLELKEEEDLVSRKFLDEDETTRLLFKYRVQQKKNAFLLGVVGGFFLGFVFLFFGLYYFQG